MAMHRPQRAVGRRWLAGLLGLATLIWLTGCATLGGTDALRVNVVGVEPLQGQGMELRFAVKLRVQNPNDIGVDYDGVAVDLELNGKNLASGVSDARGSVPRFGETVIVVPVSISAFAALRQVLGYADASQRGEIPYTVSGKLAGSAFGSVRFSHSGTLKLPSASSPAARSTEG
jgi:LEA14-like dessication related protein